MNQALKSIVGGAIAIAVLAVGYSAVSYTNSYGKSIQPSSFRSFSVSADGKSVSIPDVAQFNFQVVTQGGKDLKTLQAQNTADANKVIAFVKGQGVADKDIKTSYYNVDPRYQNYNCYEAPAPYDSKDSSVSNRTEGVAVSAPGKASGLTTKVCPPPEIVGYTVTQSVDVKMRDFSKVGDIMGGVVSNGANQVGSLNFTLDDPTKAQDVARAQAIEKAKVKAEGVAAAGGFKLGRLLNISENGSNPYPMYKSYAMDSGVSAMPASAPSPTIAAGSQETSVTVSMTYEIQ